MAAPPAGAKGDRPFGGRVALVTGASQGIGAATAVTLAAAGAHVVLTARNARKLEAVEETIFAAGGTATIAPADLAEPDSIARLAQAIGGRWPALDVLVINAAKFPALTPVWQIDGKAFNETVTLNLLATQALIAGFDAQLRRSAEATVIGVTSSVAQHPRAYWGAYGASKAAMEALLATYAAEVAETSRVRVCLLDPGATRTAMRARAYPGEDPASVKPPEAVAARIVTLLGEQWPSPHRLRVNP